jgi:hypothetical protein
MGGMILKSNLKHLLVQIVRIGSVKKISKYNNKLKGFNINIDIYIKTFYMADSKISNLPSGNLIPSTIFPILDNGITSKTTFGGLTTALAPYFLAVQVTQLGLLI